MPIAVRSRVVMTGLLIAAAMPAGTAAIDIAWAQTPATTGSAGMVPGANSFVESQARKLIESKGFTEVSSLVNDNLGIWHGTAKNGTNKVRVSVDYKGNVSANPE